jgi:sirohydrochlorin cobaltochelatase
MSSRPTNDALLLIGHGSPRYPDAADVMRRLAASLGETGHFCQVEAAVLNGSPPVAEALSRIAAPVVRVVPFFMEEGYFSQVAVPMAVGAGTRIILCPPIGIHDGMAGIIEHQALRACSNLGFQPHETAVMVIGHGSARSPGRNLVLHRHTARVASTTIFARAEAACLEEAPFVADTLASLRAHPVVVIGFFANHASHVRDDIPALIETERQGRQQQGQERGVRFVGCVVDDPAVADIVLDHASGAGA